MIFLFSFSFCFALEKKEKCKRYKDNLCVILFCCLDAIGCLCRGCFSACDKAEKGFGFICKQFTCCLSRYKRPQIYKKNTECQLQLLPTIDELLEDELIYEKV